MAGHVDMGFAEGVSRHVNEDGPAVMAVAKAGDPALWGDNVRLPFTGPRLVDARERSLQQARDLLLTGIEEFTF